MKPNAIFTACDAKYGDFLIDHWLKSLRTYTDLSELEPVILDYGLSTAQRFYLQQHDCRVVPCKRNGHVVNLRFRDMAAVLAESAYAQAFLSDSGDIIFQDDISPALRIAPDQFRGVVEDLRPVFGLYIQDDLFREEDRKPLKRLLREKQMINAGFILGPAPAMQRLGEEITRRLKSLDKFGPDQILVNDIFYRDGFHALDRGFNYVIATAQAKLEIRQGVFYADGQRIPVVHNTGNVSFMRPIEKFGFGPDRNEMKKELMVSLRALYTTTDGMMETTNEMQKRFEHFRKELAEGYETSIEQLEHATKSLLEDLNLRRK